MMESCRDEGEFGSIGRLVDGHCLFFSTELAILFQEAV
jgi:hypothetical protein